MTDPIALYRAIQGQAKSEQAKTGRPVDTSKLFTRHLLESFLDRLTKTEHADDFVLKGGILLAAYGVRRPTKDLDTAAIKVDESPQHLRRVVAGVVVEADDGIEFDLDSLTIQEIRDDADYPGLRLRMKARLATWNGVTAWDRSGRMSWPVGRVLFPCALRRTIGDHPSTVAVAGNLLRSTRELGRAALGRSRGAGLAAPSFLTLLQVGFT